MHSCRFCQASLSKTFVDLGLSPVANAFIRAEDEDQPEGFYPLHTYVCPDCLLVQLPAVRQRESLFDHDYAYFSSFSTSWLEHCRRYAESMIGCLGLGPASRVIEVASNDGYLLKFFHQQNIPVLGIEPAANCAEAARAAGIPTEVRFFGTETARDLLAQGQADLMVGNNVLAHVPDINDFVAGFKILLKPDGVLTLEFPSVYNLIRKNEFDTIYHEHYSYLSFCTAEQIFARHGLTLFDVDELETHGGSLRIYARHSENTDLPVLPSVGSLKAREEEAGLTRLDGYQGFEKNVWKVKNDLLLFLLEAQRNGKQVAGYGAPAKGNTLLNYCGIKKDLIAYTLDRSPRKQDCLLPGTRIPVHAPEHIRETKPDYLLILPWNLKDEIMEQMRFIREWGGQFVVAIPELQVLP